MDEFPLILMKPPKEDEDLKIWSAYKALVEKHEKHKFQWAKLKRQKFYEEAEKVGNAKNFKHLVLTKFYFAGICHHSNWRVRLFRKFDHHQGSGRLSRARQQGHKGQEGQIQRCRRHQEQALGLGGYQRRV